jgi:large subunit ribosomal protein L17
MIREEVVMRHQKGIKKLGRASAHRSALMRNLATELFRHERIQTTEARAKALRSFADRLITLGKRGDLHAGPRFKERAGGYTRVLKLATRRGDAASLALIELVDFAAAAKAPEVGGEKKAAEAR